jgi:putative nucleotidyltransferase with HDIG domain
VGNLSAAIAQKMGLDSKTVEAMRIIGYIHDIGKIVVPTEILSKPGKLTELEMQIIQTHSVAGYEMLRKVELPDNIAQAIFQHHERCDGSGYPQALKGTRFPSRRKSSWWRMSWKR